jgi:hypothetical protein
MSTLGTWDELFTGRKWRVAEELTGSVRHSRALVVFERGEFELPAGSAFRSLLSTNMGRRGVILQETDETGETDIPGSRIAIGHKSLIKARQDYSAVW